jgi:hypothetical protein
MFTTIYRWIYKRLPVPHGHVMSGTRLIPAYPTVKPKRYWVVHRALESLKCPVCSKPKLRGSILCTACKALPDTAQKRLLRRRLRWAFIHDYYQIIPALKAKRKQLKGESNGHETGHQKLQGQDAGVTQP